MIGFCWTEDDARSSGPTDRRYRDPVVGGFRTEAVGSTPVGDEVPVRLLETGVLGGDDPGTFYENFFWTDSVTNGLRGTFIFGMSAAGERGRKLNRYRLTTSTWRRKVQRRGPVIVQSGRVPWHERKGQENEGRILGSRPKER